MSTLEFHNRLNEITGLLQSFAFNLTKNMEDSRDLMQETIYRGMSNREKFKPGTNFKAWLFTIMKNIFINNYRRRVKANTIKDNTQNLYYINSGRGSSIHNDGESNMMMHELDTMIENLEESFKTPFLMHYHGYKYQEIADKLELPLGTVKSRIFFARRELKETINENYDNMGTFRGRKK